MEKDMNNLEFTEALKISNKDASGQKQQSKELAEALKELDYMEKYPEKYKIYHDVDKMVEDILNEE